MFRVDPILNRAKNSVFEEAAAFFQVRFYGKFGFSLSSKQWMATGHKVLDRCIVSILNHLNRLIKMTLCSEYGLVNKRIFPPKLQSTGPSMLLNPQTHVFRKRCNERSLHVERIKKAGKDRVALGRLSLMVNGNGSVLQEIQKLSVVSIVERKASRMLCFTC